MPGKWEYCVASSTGRQPRSGLDCDPVWDQSQRPKIPVGSTGPAATPHLVLAFVTCHRMAAFSPTKRTVLPVNKTVASCKCPHPTGLQPTNPHGRFPPKPADRCVASELALWCYGVYFYGLPPSAGVALESPALHRMRPTSILLKPSKPSCRQYLTQDRTIGPSELETWPRKPSPKYLGRI